MGAVTCVRARGRGVSDLVGDGVYGRRACRPHVGDVYGAAVVADGQVHRRDAHGDGRGYVVGPGGDHGDGVGTPVSHVEELAVRGDRHTGRALPDRHGGDDLVVRGVKHRYLRRLGV